MENAHTFPPSGPKTLLGSQAGLGRSGVKSTWVVVTAAPQDHDPVLHVLGCGAGWAGELVSPSGCPRGWSLETTVGGSCFGLQGSTGLRGSTGRLCQASFGDAAHSK